MTPEQIRAMSAGTAMNAAVAELVMGWTRYPKQMHPSDNRTIDGVLYCPPDFPYDMNARNVVPDYSDDIACAFKMQAEIERRELAREYSDELQVLIENQTGRCRRFDYCHASPLDRCKAALLVLVGQHDAARGE